MFNAIENDVFNPEDVESIISQVKEKTKLRVTEARQRKERFAQYLADIKAHRLHKHINLEEAEIE